MLNTTTIYCRLSTLSDLHCFTHMALLEKNWCQLLWHLQEAAAQGTSNQLPRKFSARYLSIAPSHVVA
jgi:hypothetical protein